MLVGVAIVAVLVAATCTRTMQPIIRIGCTSPHRRSDRCAPFNRRAKMLHAGIPGASVQSIEERDMTLRSTFLAAAVGILATACASGPPFIDQMQPQAIDMAVRRG